MTNEAYSADDLLEGAEAIAQFLFGSSNQRRKVYHLAATSNMPFFKFGSVLCARRSVLLNWIEAQERRHANDNRPLRNNVVPFRKGLRSYDPELD